MNKSITAFVLKMREKASEGVVYDHKKGAACPACHERLRVYCSRPWNGNVKIRYHQCANRECILHQLEMKMKSVEEEKP